MQKTIDTLKQQFLHDAKAVGTLPELEALKVKFLGKKGPIQDCMKLLREMDPQQRQAAGKLINDCKEWMQTECDQLEATLVAQEEAKKLSTERLDETLPGRSRYNGRKHPLTQALENIIDVLSGMGFSVQYGPDIDTDYYNFEVLNFPPDHPARDMQDTFYIEPHILLRTHTSNIQARVMESNVPPIRIIAPGTVYRNEAITARSHVFFHQVEALYIDKGVTFADLMATMDEFLKKIFHHEVKTRYRPSYFPFVEPGMEIDISCIRCNGCGCHLCKKTGWLEIAGAGLVHPEVLRNGGIDPEQYSGFAWGMGVERLVMLMRGISDIRMFVENDLRFLGQFSAL